MRKRFLHLVMLFAAVMVGMWPAYASMDQRHMPVPERAQAMAAMHHMDEDCGHMGAGDCAEPAAGMAVGHCSSMLMACGTGIAGTLPAVIEIPVRFHAGSPAWQAPATVLAAHSISPDIRPPRHSS